MGGIAFVRQAFADAQHYQQAAALPRRPRAPYDAALAAMGPALGGKVPVAFKASTPREIRRALAFAKEFSLVPVIVGGARRRAGRRRVEGGRCRVVVSVNYPTRPKDLAPDADEPLEALQARAAARSVAGALAAAGVPFGFGSVGLKDPKDSSPTCGSPSNAACRAMRRFAR